MKIHVTCSMVFGMITLCCSLTSSTAGDEAAVVRQGKLVSAHAIGKPWTSGDGWLECHGTDNFLVATKTPCAGDFCVRVRLTLMQLDSTAASLMIGHNHVGLDGTGRRLFVEGLQFGPTKLVGDAIEYVSPGQPFALEAARQDRLLVVRIDGREVFRSRQPLDPVTAIALRPWRATMRVHEWTVSGSLQPVAQQALRRVPLDVKELQAARVPLADSVTVGGTHIDTFAPPTGLVVRPDLGLVCVEPLDGQLLYTSKTHLFEAHGTITPGGDYLVMFPDGGHYGGKTKKVNDMMVMRSSDRGKTWSQPKVAFDIDYNQHGFVPLIPSGSQRIYAFGTQPIWDRFSVKDGQQENAPIGYRWSDDDGHTWSKVELIEPVNDPGFKGMSVMRMCETDAGTWLIGSHEGDWSIKPLMTRQYVLRSEDQGKTWTILPAPRHGGWYAKSRNRMDEGRPINLGRGEVFMMFRTATGNLWSARSPDDGKTWTDPKPTPLVHPDAPPMLFMLSDGKTLAAFHHNRFSDRNYTGLSARPEVMKDRSEIWGALSQDGGRTWSEPRFVFANALAETDRNAFFNYQCSYMDCFVDGEVLHLILPHRWKRVLHLTLPEDALRRLPTKTEIQKHAGAGRRVPLVL